MTAQTIARLEQLARTDAVVAPLAIVQAVAFREAAHPAWEEAVPALDPGRLADGLPLLQGHTLSVRAERAATLALDLAQAAEAATAAAGGAAGGAAGRGAGALRRALMEALDPLAVLEAGICQEDARLASLARSAASGDGIAPDLLATFSQLLALPLLLACGRKAAPLLGGADWDAGYCPVCAAWPALAERRGLERRRWLRCGRCAAEWTYSLQRCPYCANGDFRTLGYLAPEAEREARQAAICDACHGYLKTVATVGSLAPEEVGAHDLTTLELDMAALEQGYGRPDERGFPLDVRVVAAGPAEAAGPAPPGEAPAPLGARRTRWLPWRRSLRPRAQPTGRR